MERNVYRINMYNYKKIKFLLRLTLFVLILSIVVIPSTYAMFHTEVDKTTEIPVATWSFKVGDEEESYDIDLASTITDNDYSLTSVVPGTCGIIQFSIDFSNTEVSTKYKVEIDSDNSSYPSNLGFYVDSSYNEVFSGYYGNVSLDDINTKLIKRIYWRWDYTDEDESVWANREIKLNLIATGEQEVN